jgi:alkylation response protein AidB-like acyl-CoA dehydrogenase
LGFLCTQIPENYGGAGGERHYSVIVLEEVARANASGLGFSLHSDIVATYILRYGSEAQKQLFLPRMARGEVVGAIAMTEPGTGSDLQAITTTARAEGEEYILNGSKIFITNGWHCDLVIVAAKFGDVAAGAANVGLLLVDAHAQGFSKGKPLKKIGMKAQDTCELFFDEVRVPKANLLGAEGAGFMILMQELAWERLMIAIACVAAAEQVLEQTIAYTKERHVFNRPLIKLQDARFKLADLKTQVAVARVYIDRCIELEVSKNLKIEAAAAAKLHASEMLCAVVDQCVQLHGGYGYILDYPVAKAYADARVQRIYGGTSEIMKEIIARSL